MNNTRLLHSTTLYRYYPLFVISLCACFLFYKYVLQIYPSIITEPLMREFQLTGAGLGNLAATFYYAFMITQLFVGITIDKYGARWLTSVAIFSCALGIFWFSQTQSLFIAELSRALMGIGVSFATVAYMKLAATWFPARQYAFVSGLLATAAMAGAVFGQAPLAVLVSDYGWRQCLSFLGIAGFVLTFLFVLIVRDSPTMPAANKHHSITLRDLFTVFKNKQNWLLTFYSGLAFSPVAVFGGLWGNPFLEQAYHLSKTQSASMISCVFIGLGIGSPLLGILSDRLGERRQVMFYSTLLATVMVCLVLYWNTMPIWLLSVLLFSFGFTLGSFMLIFAIGKELNNPRLTATVIAMINASDAILSGFTEPSIGKLLDLNWDGTMVDGVRYFSLHSYHVGLSVLPMYLLIATLLLLLVKTKNEATHIDETA